MLQIFIREVIMKVIAGRYRWKKIHTSKKGLKTDFKPTKSIVREAVFNIINHYEFKGEFEILESKALDIFCGSGSYGIEALSRGSKSVHFINNNRAHLDLVRHNIEFLNDPSIDAEYIFADATKLRKMMVSFDLAFIDPPYRSDVWKNCLECLHQNIDFSSNNLIFLELSTTQKFDLPKGFDYLDKKTYGNTAIYVLRLK